MRTAAGIVTYASYAATTTPAAAASAAWLLSTLAVYDQAPSARAQGCYPEAQRQVLEHRLGHASRDDHGGEWGRGKTAPVLAYLHLWRQRRRRRRLVNVVSPCSQGCGVSSH